MLLVISSKGAYGQERIETRSIPITMADLTLNAIRKAVNSPPQVIPIHICRPVSLSQYNRPEYYLQLDLS
jgi:hypothetical protein